MRRREIIAGLAGAAAWPRLLRAQNQATPVIGWLASVDAARDYQLASFKEGLRKGGYIEGRNVAFEYRWANDHLEKLPDMAADLVRRQVSVIVTIGGGVPALAAKAATATIPVVFANGEDPVKIGLVDSLNRPGGNVTGVSFITIETGPKRWEFLREMLPDATRIAMLINPSSANAANMAGVTALENIAQAAGMQLIVERAGTEADIDAAFSPLAEQRAQALMVLTDPFLAAQRQRVVAQAARNAIPTIYSLREFVVAGGLSSYGASITEAMRLAGGYTARILGGARPADLPVIESTKIEFVINLKTANALGLWVPTTLIARADEIIE